MKQKSSKNNCYSKKYEKAIQDIKPTPPLSGSRLVAEKQNNFPHYLDHSKMAPSNENGSVQSINCESEIMAPNGGLGWLIVLASFFMHVIGMYTY